MPPRHTYWTIIFGNQPTAFRAAEREELLPTFRQIQAKHPDAIMMWFARGRLWKSPEEARETFDRRRSGEGGRGPLPESRGRSSKPPGEWRNRPRDDRAPGPPTPRSGEGGRDPRGPKPAWQNRGPKPEWREKPRFDRPPGPPAFARKPSGPGYGGATPPGPPKSRSDEGGKPGDTPRSGEAGKPPWRDKPRDDRPRDPSPPRPEWRDKPRGPKPPWLGPPKPRSGEGGRDKPRDDRPHGPRPPAFARKPSGPPWRDKPRDDRPRDPQAPRPEWRPRGPKPQWKPRDERPGIPQPPASPPGPAKSRSDEGGKPRSDEGGRGRDWRPGGAHKDPRDRFKVPRDVKRARFKQNLRRDRSNPKPAPPKPRSGEGGPRKKKDEE